MVSFLFTEGAVVHSPLYGIVPSAQFYFDLFNDTSTSKITLLHVFSSTDDVNTIAAYFHYDWVLKDGTPTGFDCVDVFRLDEAGKITSLHIIYDTAAIRPAFINR